MPRHVRFTSLIFATWVAVMSGQAQRPVPRAEPVTTPGSSFSNVPGNTAPGYSAIERAGRSAVAIDPNKRLNVGDAVSIEIVEDQEGPFTREVSPTGEIEVFPLGRVRVNGKTTSEAEADIKRKLEADYYHAATVRVAIDRINPTASLRKVQVTGEVRAPGPYEWPTSEPMHLTEAINRAGNFTEWADSANVVLYRLINGATQSSKHNVKDIQKSGKISEDPRLQDGDRIFVPKKLFRFN